MKIITKAVKEIPDYNIESIAPKGDVLLFDIETTGLKKETTQVYLIGCSYYENDCWIIRQYLAESAIDEAEVIESFLDLASNYKVLVHFNGDGFDIPYMKYKVEYYGFSFNFDDLISFDIYKQAKRLKKFLNMQKMGQKAIEIFLGIERDDQLNGGLLIPYFYEYEKTGEKELEDLLLLHNFDDIQGMFKILAILKYADVLSGNFEFESYEECQGFAIFNYRLNNPVPVRYLKELDNFDVICLEGNLLQINRKLYSGEAKYFFPDVENYYYLPEEDRVIHKDVAMFVEKCHRKKATKTNCYIKKEGVFLAQEKDLFEPFYHIDCDKKRTYFELCSEIIQNKELLKCYALAIINC
ncbi:MAG: ribonuclease H-like domain-containing protein [Lachnospiraceae bacterium]|nr:ribonuclease H-like domain-containing protein [Lachnospiraceae bacterium]